MAGPHPEDGRRLGLPAPRPARFPTLFWASARISARGSGRHGPAHRQDRADFGVVLGATLTLLGLLIGFSFSMAVSRYDQRKNFEEAEANAIGTEYVRADLLPAGDAAEVRKLLKKYLDQRMLFYTTRDPQTLAKINADTAELQKRVVVRGPAGSGGAAHTSTCPRQFPA